MEQAFSHIEDFLSDESFRSWVTNPTPDLDRYWVAWLQDNPDKQAMANQAKALISGLSFREYVPDPESKERIFEQIQQETDVIRQNTFWKSRSWLRVAAVVLVLVSTVALWMYLSPPTPAKMALSEGSEALQVSTALGQRSQYTLPDGSTVYLNSGSTLTYPEAFQHAERVVELTGEAFFEVTSDPQKPFRVLSQDIEVVVLGTEFNLNARTDEPTVALVEGKVRLRSQANNASMELNPSQMATFKPRRGGFMLTSFDPKVVAGWKEGYLTFRDATLDEVVQKLHSWYGVGVRVVNQAPEVEWSYTATFRNESLENVLLNMSTLRPFDYQIQNDSLILSFP